MKGLKHQRVTLAAVMAGGVLSLSACGGVKGEGEAVAAEPKAKLPVVETIKVESVEFASVFTLTGQSEADETVTVSAEIPGLVFRADFEEGDEVKAGQRLARMDVRIDQARAGQLRANLQQSQRDYERAQALYDKGLATQADLERARLAVQNNRYNLRQTSIGVGKSVLTAPISGVIDVAHITSGEYANPGQPLATIVNYDRVLVLAGIPESRLRYAKEGREVLVRFPALGVKRVGVIERIGVQANTKNRTFPIKVAIDNKDHLIRPGMRARVKLRGEEVAGALLVPRDVVIDTLEGPVVYAVSKGKATRREVKLGADYRDYVVLTEGIQPGEELVSVGQHSLPRVADVDVVKTRPCCRSVLADDPDQGEWDDASQQKTGGDAK